MNNLVMQQMLTAGECIDVLTIGEEIEPGRYLLNSDFDDSVDYCDAQKELWIWSVGRKHTTGQVFASTGSELYQNPEYECLWLR